MKTPEDQAESIINEWNADYVEEDTTIDPDKGETIDSKKFYAHLEGLVADALREKDKQLQEATKDREHWRLDATKSHVECDNLKQRIAALEHGESEYQKALQAYENQVVTLECRIAALEKALGPRRRRFAGEGET